MSKPDGIPNVGPERDAEVHRLLIRAGFFLDWIGPLAYSTDETAADRLRRALVTKYRVLGFPPDNDIALCHPDGRAITNWVAGKDHADALSKAALLALRAGQ